MNTKDKATPRGVYKSYKRALATQWIFVSFTIKLYHSHPTIYAALFSGSLKQSLSS